jgi:molybdenum cofactor cytidylyltransferase
LTEVKTVDCVLLGAGASVRLGQPKLLLPLGEKTVLEIVLANHLASSVRRICAVVPGWLAGFREITRNQEGGRLKVLEMECPCSMSDSLRRGWQWVGEAWKPDGVMISLADKPLVTTQTINLVMAAYAAGDREIVAPVYAGRRGHPVILSSRLGPEILALEGDRGAADVLAADPSRVAEIEVASDGILIDMDTAEDVLELKKRLGFDG